MKIHNIEQGTPEWHEIRKGKMTASHAQEIGNNGKGLDTYITKLMAKYFSNGEEEGYTNENMQRGIELEDQARSIYELETGNIVDQVGFVELDNFVGCSPDGLIGEDGGLEIKCKGDLNHFKNILDENAIESKYIWQIQMNLLVTGRKWWDYVSYNPNFKKSLVIVRIKPDEEMHEKLLDGFEKGVGKITEIISFMSK
jgi:putative phage-type endonuclease